MQRQCRKEEKEIFIRSSQPPGGCNAARDRYGWVHPFALLTTSGVFRDRSDVTLLNVMRATKRR